MSQEFGVLDPLFMNAEDFVSPPDHVTPGLRDIDKTNLAVYFVGTGNLIDFGKGNSVVEVESIRHTVLRYDLAGAYSMKVLWR